MLGEDGGYHLEKFFVNNLSRNFFVTLFSNHALYSCGNGEEIILFSTPKLVKCEISPCISVLTPHSQTQPIFPMSGIVIASSDDETQRKLLAKSKIPVITCGLSSKDTITFSSKEEECGVISLMREVRSVFGNTIEPMEIPVSFPKHTEPFMVLAYTASLILSEFVSTQNDANKTKFFQS
ncbi:hypothetical protein [Chryseobacterium sp.]|uniref:hypothetical protein n=1 Tax=Chryseobacterium sp. TaxID=1871047 RepID=UPI002FC7900D